MKCACSRLDGNLTRLFYHRKCYKKAEKIANKNSIGTELSWLCGRDGVDFYLGDNSANMKLSDLESNSSSLSSQDCRLEPSVRLLRHYRDSHLLSASDTIICPTAESKLSSVLPVLASVSQSNVKVGSLTGDRQDEEAEWWTALLRCGALWCANKMTEAQQTYPEIDKLPIQYQVGRWGAWSLYCIA